MRSMADAVIVSTARTPLCKSWRGAFNMTHGATLGGHALRHAMDRAHVDPGEIDDLSFLFKNDSRCRHSASVALADDHVAAGRVVQNLLDGCLPERLPQCRR